MSALAALAFDFDGTLVESVGIKDAAFAAIYADHPERLAEIMAYHRAHNHTVRFIKFEHIHCNILGLPYTDVVREDLSRRFSEAVYQAIVDAPWVPGAQEILARHKGRVPLFLVSMSPGEEFRRILAARGLADTFDGVYDSSWNKTTALADILRRTGASPAQAAYVGDTEEDRACALEAGIRFLGRNSGRPLPPGTEVHADMRGVLQSLEGWR